MPQLRGGTLPNVARIELGSQLEAFQGTLLCHRRHLLSDYKSFRKAFSSLMKNRYFFTSNTNSKPNFKASALSPLQRNKLFCVNTAWLCADFYMRHCQNSYTTSTAAAHTSTKTWRGKGNGYRASLLNCLLRTRQTRTTKQVPVLPFTQHSGTCQDRKLGSCSLPVPRGANWELSTQLKVKQTWQKERQLCCSKED